MSITTGIINGINSRYKAAERDERINNQDKLTANANTKLAQDTATYKDEYKHALANAQTAYQNSINSAKTDYSNSMNNAQNAYQQAADKYTGDNGYKNALGLAQEGAAQSAAQAGSAVQGNARSTGMSKAAAAALGAGSVVNAYNGGLANQQTQAQNSYNNAMNAAGNVYSTNTNAAGNLLNTSANAAGNTYSTNANAAGNQYSTQANTANQIAANTINTANTQITNQMNAMNQDYANQDFVQKAFNIGAASDERLKTDVTKIRNDYDRASDILNKKCRKYSDLIIRRN